MSTSDKPKFDATTNSIPIVASTQIVPGAYAGLGLLPDAKVDVGTGAAALGRHMEDSVAKREQDVRAKAADAKLRTGKRMTISSSYIPPLLPDDQLEREPQVRFHRSKKKEDKLAVFYCAWSKDWTTAFARPKDLFKTQYIEFRNVTNWLRNMQYATANMSKVTKVTVNGCLLHSDALSDLFRLPSLTELELIACTTLTSFPVADLPSSTLRLLRISGCDQVVWTALAGGPLQALEVLHFPLMPWSLHLDLSGCSSLHTLVLGSGKRSHSERIEIGNSRTLRCIRVEAGASLRTLVLQSLYALEHCILATQVQLNRLQLHSCPSLTALDLRAIVQANGSMQQLQQVRLINCGLLAHLWLPHQVLPPDMLDIDNCARLTDVQLNTFAGENRLPALDSLSCKSSVVAQSLRLHKCGALRDVRVDRWPRLAVVEITQCSLVEEQMLTRLLANLPFLRDLSLAGSRRLTELPSALWTKPGLLSVDVRDCPHLVQLNLPNATAAAAAVAQVTTVKIKVFVDLDLFDELDDLGIFEEPCMGFPQALTAHEDPPAKQHHNTIRHQPPPPPPPLPPPPRAPRPPPTLKLKPPQQQKGLFRTLSSSLKKVFARGRRPSDDGSDVFPAPETHLPTAADYWQADASKKQGNMLDGHTADNVAKGDNHCSPQKGGAAADAPVDVESGTAVNIRQEALIAAQELAQQAQIAEEVAMQVPSSMAFQALSLQCDDRCEAGMVTKCPPDQTTFEWDFRNSGAGDNEFQIEFSDVTVHRLGVVGHLQLMSEPYHTLAYVTTNLQVCKHAHRSVTIKVVSLQAFSSEVRGSSTIGQGNMAEPENLLPYALQFYGMPLYGKTEASETTPPLLKPLPSRKAGSFSGPIDTTNKVMRSSAKRLRFTQGFERSLHSASLQPPRTSLQQVKPENQRAGGPKLPDKGTAGNPTVSNTLAGDTGDTSGMAPCPMAAVTRIKAMENPSLPGLTAAGAFSLERLPCSSIRIPATGRARAHKREFSEAWIDEVLEKTKAVDVEQQSTTEKQCNTQTSDADTTTPGASETTSLPGDTKAPNEATRGKKLLRKKRQPMGLEGALLSGDYEVLDLHDLPDDKVPVVLQWVWPSSVVPDEVQVRVSLCLTLGRVHSRERRRISPHEEELSVSMRRSRVVLLPPVDVTFRFPVRSSLPLPPQAPVIDKKAVLNKMGISLAALKPAHQVLAEAEAEAYQTNPGEGCIEEEVSSAAPRATDAAGPAHDMMGDQQTLQMPLASRGTYSNTSMPRAHFRSHSEAINVTPRHERMPSSSTSSSRAGLQRYLGQDRAAASRRPSSSNIRAMDLSADIAEHKGPQAGHSRRSTRTSQVSRDLGTERLHRPQTCSSLEQPD